MLRGVPVEVLRPVRMTDSHGNEAESSETRELVENVLPAPVSTSELGAERPDGTKIEMRFHFPKTYKQDLEGCFIVYGGSKWRILGNPQPFFDSLTPGDWDRAAEAGIVNG